MTPDTPEPEPRFERFNRHLPDRHRIECYYAGGATLREARVTHPLTVVEVAEPE